MTALIADTSPILRNIPSDPPADHRRSFEFSPSPIMPARYLPEGSQDRVHSSPSPRSYAPTPFPQHFGFPTMAGAFAHHKPGAPARLAGKSCQCQQQCSCSSPASKASQFQQQQQQQQQGTSKPQPSMWRSNSDNTIKTGSSSNNNSAGSSSNNNSIKTTAVRPSDLFHGEAPSRPGAAAAADNKHTASPAAVSVAAPSRSPSPSAVFPQQRRAVPAVEPTSSPAKKSDWENLLGAVDLELRAQERARVVPDSSTATAVPPHTFANSISAAHYHYQQQCSPFHLSDAGDSHNSSGSSRCTQSAAVSPEFGPIKTAAAPRHHRRGGGMEGISGGGPAYSGSTADAACLLATLPQRMLDRTPKHHQHDHHHHQQHKNHHHHQPMASAAAAACGLGSGAVPAMLHSPRPALVSAAGPPVTPVRVQASGRRGPRGQSRFKGVCITRAGKWRAVIYIGRKQKYLGVFDSEFDAARAYDAAALEHFAEGAKLNFPDGVEQQLNDLSSGASGRPFPTAGAGAGGAAAPRAATPPYLDAMPPLPRHMQQHMQHMEQQQHQLEPSSAGKRTRKSAFGEDDDGEWVREAGPWNSSRI